MLKIIMLTVWIFFSENVTVDGNQNMFPIVIIYFVMFYFLR